MRALLAYGTEGPCRADVVAPAADASWQYRIPEGLSCDEGQFKTWYYPILDWQGPDADGALWHEWETNDADLAALEADPRTAQHDSKFIKGIHYRVTISPSVDGLALQFRVTNRSDRTFHNLRVFRCLGMPSDNFEDDALERTFIVTEGDLTPLKDTDRGTGEWVRTHYHVSGTGPWGAGEGVWFWGEASKTEATEGVILRTSADSRFTVGTNWERAYEIYNNEDEHHHCIHSVPRFKVLGPGEVGTLHGKIVLVEGGAEDALERLRLLE
ncbi:MAG: hypothetical protein GX620_15435 [Chloroflexi bacterium]|nr:hypothetical protein [Chloroflexota bacterium]